MKIANIFLPASVLLLSGDTVAARRRRPKSNKAGKGGKGGKGSKSEGDGDTAPIIGEPEIFASFDFSKNESPESIVFDSKGYAYVSFSLTARISVLNPEGEEIRQIDMPQGDCRPVVPSDVQFPIPSLAFGLTMSKDDVLYFAFSACAEGFPQPPIPNPKTGLWMIDTEDYSIKQIAQIPNGDGRGRQDFCCEWNLAYYSDGGEAFCNGPNNPPCVWDSSTGRNDDGTCDLETCAFYEAWNGSQFLTFFGGYPFRGYAELWNGIEVVGDCVYLTNTYYNDVQRVCRPTDDVDAMWPVEVWMERGAIGTNPLLQRAQGTPFFNVGLNGIKYFDGAFYIANTSGERIVKVPLLPADSSPKSPKAGKQSSIESIIRNTGGRGIIPGTPELVWEGGDVDEFTFDAKGNIYAALFQGNKVVKISTDGTVTTLLDGGPAFGMPPCPSLEAIEAYAPLPEIDLPTSVGFGTGPAGDMTLYVANSAFVLYKGAAGQPCPLPDGTQGYFTAYPGITTISVGEKGAKQMW